MKGCWVTITLATMYNEIHSTFGGQSAGPPRATISATHMHNVSISNVPLLLPYGSITYCTFVYTGWNVLLTLAG